MKRPKQELTPPRRLGYGTETRPESYDHSEYQKVFVEARTIVYDDVRQVVRDTTDEVSSCTQMESARAGMCSIIYSL